MDDIKNIRKIIVNTQTISLFLSPIIRMRLTMQNIEPYYGWQKYYNPYQDEHSPFYGISNHPTLCRNVIYNHYIHPQWDEFESNTLYMKLQYANYEIGFAVIELMGEWNDCLYNDIMFLKRNVIDVLVNNGVRHFLLIGENVLNFHSSDDLYYEEWFDDIEDGWIIACNFREHVMQEFDRVNLSYYMMYGGNFSEINWRTAKPLKLFDALNSLMSKGLNP